MNENNGHIKNVALYTRVSTDEQAREGFSLDSQLDKLRHYCIAREWNIIAEYTDPGYTGRNIKRPQYQQMMQDIDKWDGILVIKMDRIHRNRLNFISMMDKLKKSGKEFISMHESLDTSTAMGRFVMGIIQDIAQLESEMIAERVYTAQEQKAKTPDEGWMGHAVPYGYEWDGDHKKLITIPSEIEKIKEIYRIYNEEDIGLIPLAKKVKVSKPTVHYVLHNSFYAGYERWCNYFRPTGLELVISVELYNQTQKKLHSRNYSHRSHQEPIKLKPKSGSDLIKIEKERTKVFPLFSKARHNYTY